MVDLSAKNISKNLEKVEFSRIFNAFQGFPLIFIDLFKDVYVCPRMFKDFQGEWPPCLNISRMTENFGPWSFASTVYPFYFTPDQVSSNSVK